MKDLRKTFQRRKWLKSKKHFVVIIWRATQQFKLLQQPSSNSSNWVSKNDEEMCVPDSFKENRLVRTRRSWFINRLVRRGFLFNESFEKRHIRKFYSDIVIHNLYEVCKQWTGFYRRFEVGKEECRQERRRKREPGRKNDRCKKINNHKKMHIRRNKNRWEGWFIDVKRTEENNVRV